MRLQRNKGCILAVVFRKAAHSFIHLTHFYLVYVSSTIPHSGESVVNKTDTLRLHRIYILIEIDC